MIVVVDASVALKWFLFDSLAEDHTDIALAIFEAAVFGRIQLLQPVHFIAEVALFWRGSSPQKPSLTCWI